MASSVPLRTDFDKTSAQFMIFSRCQILYVLENHIGVFMDIFIYESARRIGDQNVLRKIDALMDWSLVLPLLKSGLNRSGLGHRDMMRLFCLNVCRSANGMRGVF